MLKTRKVRSDKKHTIKPTIPVKLKETINRISYITTTPVKDVGEFICESGLHSKQVIEILSGHFRRSYHFNNTVYFGELERKSLQREKYNVPTERATIRFKESTNEQINALAYSLDVTPSKATALLLETSIKNPIIINQYLKMYLQKNIDTTRIKELKKIIKFINDNNPYEEEISWSEILSYIYKEIKTSTTTMTAAITGFIEKHRK
ncbi:hypothetical protein QUF94_27990 [Peribacillus sp. NJ4]|uniref:hypothetical protein n=1 Tax=Peribacillus sp. NJ4 TaxID=3055862 RepID=UPI0025A0C412|nr:hypothetical protein [Peribacillus sp. NJ4]MDM5215154.1 hypothetical protein [Peribacillus sp. NJ4]